MHFMISSLLNNTGVLVTPYTPPVFSLSPFLSSTFFSLFLSSSFSAEFSSPALRSMNSSQDGLPCAPALCPKQFGISSEFSYPSSQHSRNSIKAGTP